RAARQSGEPKRQQATSAIGSGSAVQTWGRGLGGGVSPLLQQYRNIMRQVFLELDIRQVQFAAILGELGVFLASINKVGIWDRVVKPGWHALPEGRGIAPGSPWVGRRAAHD